MSVQMKKETIEVTVLYEIEFDASNPSMRAEAIEAIQPFQNTKVAVEGGTHMVVRCVGLKDKVAAAA